MSSSENFNEQKNGEISSNQLKKESSPSSLKHDKFKGLTSEEIIKKYEKVLFSRERQFSELSKEVDKLTQTIQNLVSKKNKSKYTNDKLKEELEKNEQILKQELSNKEIVFMKLTNLEHKYDDLQNKIDDIINKQNALAESSMREKEKSNQDREESKKLIDKTPFKILEENNNKEIKNEEKEEIVNKAEENKNYRNIC